MTRTEKIKKLSNAIKTWRGSWDNVTGKWVRPSQESAKERVAHWLYQLGLDVQAELSRIEKFPTHVEFHAWLKELEKPCK